MCRTAAFAIVLVVALGCGSANTYQVEANPSNFPPPRTGGRTWIFHASPTFDSSAPSKLRKYVNDALEHLGLPPVKSDGKPSDGDWRRWSEGFGEHQFVWSSFEWNEYSEGPLLVRTGAYAKRPEKDRVVFVRVETKR